MALSAALQVLNWFEAPPDEVPPEDIWHHSRRLEEFFAAVKQRRETGQKPIEDDDAEMSHNELLDDVMGGDRSGG